MISSVMRCSRTPACVLHADRRFSFGLRIGGGDEQAEAEVAGKAERDRAADRPRELQFEQAAQRVRLREVMLAAEAMACSFPLHAGMPQVKFRNLPTVRR